MKGQWNISPIAHKKIVFHCLRYPSSKVYGALASTKEHEITNAYPLFHTPLVAPTLSIALDLIQSNLQPNEVIIGFYEFMNEGQTNPNMDRLFLHHPQFKQMILTKVEVKDKNFFMKVNGEQLVLPDMQEIKGDLLKGEHWRIVDMDAHFEEIELDFRNEYVKCD